MNQRQAYPSLPQAWGIFAIFVGISLILGVGISAVNEALNINNLSIGNFLGYNLSMLFIIWFAWRNIRTANSRVFHFNRIDSMLYPLIILVTLSLGIVLDPLTNLIPMPDFVREIFEQLSKKDIWTFLMVCISGPILEELLFRGIIVSIRFIRIARD